jgi:hypothetical protein
VSQRCSPEVYGISLGNEGAHAVHWLASVQALHAALQAVHTQPPAELEYLPVGHVLRQLKEAAS